jgi:hypothetical protein
MALQEQLISGESLLEGRAHEGISRSRLSENSEMDPEEAQVDDEGPEDETTCTGKEVRVEVILYRMLEVSEQDSDSNVPWCALPCEHRGHPTSRTRQRHRCRIPSGYR